MSTHTPQPLAQVNLWSIQFTSHICAQSARKPNRHGTHSPKPGRIYIYIYIYIRSITKPLRRATLHTLSATNKASASIYITEERKKNHTRWRIYNTHTLHARGGSDGVVAGKKARISISLSIRGSEGWRRARYIAHWSVAAAACVLSPPYTCIYIRRGRKAERGENVVEGKSESEHHVGKYINARREIFGSVRV